MAVFLAGNIWAAVADSYQTLKGSRILMGAGTSAFECLVSATISEIYFLHERGKRLALNVMAYYVGIYLSPIIGAVVVSNPSMGWKWTFGLTALFAGLAFILLLLLVPETQYRRPASLPIDTDASMPSHNGRYIPTKTYPEQLTNEDASTSAAPKSPSFLRGLSLYSGRCSRQNFILLYLRPIILLFTNPAILWATLMGGVGSTWTAGPSFILAEYFTAPPYNFSIKQVGYLWFAPFIACFVAYFTGGIITDWVVKRMTRANSNTFEPEFRLFLAVPALITAIIGFIGFGWSLQDGAPWIAPCLTYAFQLGSVIYSNIAASAYISDAWAGDALDIFVIMYSFKACPWTQYLLSFADIGRTSFVSGCPTGSFRGSPKMG